MEIQYSSYISLGSPPQTFKVLIDTGSYLLWIHSSLSDCKKCSKFDESESDSFQSKNSKLSLNYLKGSVEGRLCKDLINFAEKTSNNTLFLLADDVNDMDYLQADGILGLGYNGDENLKNSLVFNLFLEFQIESPIFAINLNKIHENSYLLIGEDEKEKFGIGKKVNVFEDFYSWTGRLDKVVIGELEISDYNTVYFDSGLSFFTGPEKQVLAILDFFKKMLTECVQDYYLSCFCTKNQLKNLPVLKFFIEGHEFRVQPENYVVFLQKRCNFLFVSSGSENWGAGMGFFREYYSVFNYSDHSITFYNKTTEKTSIFQGFSDRSNKDTLIIVILLMAFGLVLYTFREIRKTTTDYYLMKNNDNSCPLFST
jgi:hypothetical protein